MTDEQFGNLLDLMEREIKQARNESSVVANALAECRHAVRSQNVHLDRLSAQVGLVRDQMLSLNRWSDDGGR